MLIEKYKRQ
jgi:hypothetical protein